MSLKYLSCPSKILAASISGSATSFKLNNIKGWNGVDLTPADFGSQAFAVIRNANNTLLELIEFDPATIADASITISKRGLKFTGDLTTEVSANKLSWTKGDTYIDIGVDTPQMLQWIQEYVDAAIVAGGVPSTTSVLGLVKMASAPADPANPIAVGTNDARLPTTDEKAGMTGVNNTPDAGNPFVTTDDLSDPTFKPPQVVSFTTPSASIGGDSTTQFDITNPTGTTFRYTFDGTGTNPNITSSNPAVGSTIYIKALNFNAANNGLFTVTGSGTNYFEVTNASGVAETNKTIGVSGYIVIGTIWTKDPGLKYIILEVQAGGSGGNGYDTDGTNGPADSGHGGGYLKKLILASALSNTHMVVVGAGGTGGESASTATPGTIGKDSLFSSAYVALGGPVPQATTGGGTASGGDINIPGGIGTRARGATNSGLESRGGNSFLGVGSMRDDATAVVPGGGYGYGGAGGFDDYAEDGENGGSGIVIVTEYYS